MGEFGKKAKRLVDQIDRQFGKGLGMHVVGFDTKGEPRGDGDKEC